MIKSVTYKENKGRLYAIVTRDTPSRGDEINITIRNADDEFTHTKFLPNEGAEVSIDLTPYCKAYMTDKLGNVLIAKGIVDGAQKNFSVLVKVSNGYALYYNGYDFPHVGILTKLPYLQVSKSSEGNVDAIHIGVIVADDGNITVSTDQESIALPTSLAEVISFCTLEGNTTHIRMFDNYNVWPDEDIQNNYLRVRAVPRGMNTRRLIWRNELGGIDAWSFEFLRESTFATTSEVFYSTLNGYTRTNRQYERLNVVETREVDERVADALAYITASPDVYLWDYETNKPIPIDIVSEECRTYSDTELTSIQIAYRPKERETL